MGTVEARSGDNMIGLGVAEDGEAEGRKNIFENVQTLLFFLSFKSSQ